jgi:hypothetical protein
MTTWTISDPEHDTPPTWLAEPILPIQWTRARALAGAHTHAWVTWAESVHLTADLAASTYATWADAQTACQTWLDSLEGYERVPGGGLLPAPEHITGTRRVRWVVGRTGDVTVTVRRPPHDRLITSPPLVAVELTWADTGEWVGLRLEPIARTRHLTAARWCMDALLSEDAHTGCERPHGILWDVPEQRHTYTEAERVERACLVHDAWIEWLDSQSLQDSGRAALRRLSDGGYDTMALVDTPEGPALVGIGIVDGDSAPLDLSRVGTVRTVLCGYSSRECVVEHMLDQALRWEHVAHQSPVDLRERARAQAEVAS